MANFYYVSDGATVGTATGDGGLVTGTRSTGSFASKGANACYVSIAAAFGATTPPAAGDFIMVASDHAHDYTATFSVTFAGGAAAAINLPLTIISVDVDNCDQYLAGASETQTGGTASDDMVYAGHLHWKGISVEPRDNLSITSMNGVWEDGTITLTTLANNLLIDGANSWIVFRNMIFAGANQNSINCDVGNVVLFDRCSFTGAGWTLGLFLSSGVDVGGTRAEYNECDLTAISTGNYLMEGVGGVSGDDKMHITFRSCKLNPNLAGYMNESWINYAQYLYVINSADTNGEAEYQYFHSSFTGDAENITTTYRNQSTPWSISGLKTSLLVDTSTIARANPIQPFVIDFPTRFCDFSDVATDVVTIYFSGPSSMTNQDVWATMTYPDAANTHIYNAVSTQNADPLLPAASGTALTVDTGSTWQSGGATNYRLELTTAGNPGEACVPKITVYVAKQTTIYFDTQVDLS